MTNKNTWLILAKDALFVVAGCILLLRVRGFLGTLVGLLMVIWYGRDLWYRGKAWLGTKERKREPVERPSETRRTDDAPIIDDGKIQVTDLSAAKEVEFEKE